MTVVGIPNLCTISLARNFIVVIEFASLTALASTHLVRPSVMVMRCQFFLRVLGRLTTKSKKMNLKG